MNNKNHKPYENQKGQTLPAKYAPGFLQQLDGRTRTFEKLHQAHIEILADVGGEESLSHIQKALIERFVFLEFSLRSIEARIAQDPKKSGHEINRWVTGLNSLLGLGKTIGLERRARKITSLSTYIAKGKESA
jgi:hypothetical protein